MLQTLRCVGKRAGVRWSSQLPQHVAVIGAGQMSTGIAIVAAHQANARVTVFGADQTDIDRCTAKVVDWGNNQFHKRALTSEQRDAVQERIRYKILKSDASELGSCDFVIEAVTEKFGVKADVLGLVDTASNADAIIASNTSSISITKLASVTKRPDKVIGMHFMNPVPVMKGLEIIRGLATSDATMETTLALGRAMKKIPTVSLKDTPGFVVNRVLMPMINEAVMALHEGIMTKEDIDTSMKGCVGHPMGPITLADMIGLDTCLAIMKVWAQHKNYKYTIIDTSYFYFGLVLGCIDADLRK